MSAISEIGNKYTRLTVINRAENKDKKAMWNCVCDCGNTKVVSGTHLRTKHVVSCGCYHSEVVAQMGKNNKGKIFSRGNARKYTNYVGVLGEVVGVTDRSEKNGGVQYLVKCAKCGEIHKRNSKHLKHGHEAKNCKAYKPPNKLFEDRRDGIIRRQYGITLADYEQMLHEQNYKCAICGNEDEVEGRRLAIDHCHNSGKVRGLLCGKCNRALGLFYDNQELLENAISYLKKNSLAR
jgi:hypothetical protein